MRPLRQLAQQLDRLSPARCLALWVLGIVAFSFAPFRVKYGGPRKESNTVYYAPNGDLVLGEPSIARTDAAPRWAALAIEEGRATVRVTARRDSAGQRGPARLLTLSSGAYERNFMIAQKGVDLIVRARREGADANGAPPLKVDGVFAEDTWRTIEVVFTPQDVTVLVDGELGAREASAVSPLSLWDPAFRLALGDEVDGARGWSGKLRSAQADVGPESFDLMKVSAFIAPSEVWTVPEQTRSLFRVESSWAAIVTAVHAVLFAPFGFALWRLMRRKREGSAASGNGRLLFAIAVVAALIGAVLQVAKLGFDGRHPSLYHALPDAIGALGGALVALRIGRQDP